MLLPYSVRFPASFEPRHIALAVYFCCLQIAAGTEGASVS